MMLKLLLHGEILQKVLRNKMQEPKIMKMDWRSLGYWPVYKDGKLTWEKEPDAE
jgi:hypothetical protein